jgi:hypothetical protein
MLKEYRWVQVINTEGGKIGVTKDTLRKWKIMLIVLYTIEAAVRQKRGLSQGLETFIDRKMGDIKMSDLVLADPN